MLRGIVFDMDGVIVDSHAAHRSAWKSFLESEGREARDEELDFILDGRKREEILRHFFGEVTPKQIVEYGHRKDELLRECGKRIQTILGVVEFLVHLSQARVSSVKMLWLEHVEQSRSDRMCAWSPLTAGFAESAANGAAHP